MNALTINKILKSDPVVAKSFYGVVPSDHMPRRIAVPCSLVVNTDPSTKPGQHWVAFFIDSNRHGSYFDSFGREPHKEEFKDFLTKNCPTWEYNKCQIQSPFVSTCGQYCIYFLLYKCRGNSLKQIIKTFEDFEDNDQAVTDFINDHFDVNTSIIDENFLLNQISMAFGNV